MEELCLENGGASPGDDEESASSAANGSEGRPSAVESDSLNGSRRVSAVERLLTVDLAGHQ